MKYTLPLLVTIALIGCKNTNQPSADAKVAEQTEQAMQESLKQIGQPNITNWQEKKLVRYLYELRDQENLQTYTYIISMTGELVFVGESIGYGIPASVQFTNPQRVAKNAGDFGQYADDILMPQPEPNGLFMPEGLSATWVFLIDPDGEPRATYIESEITVSPFKLH